MEKEKHQVGFKFFKSILGVIFTCYYRPKYLNKEVIPKEGPIIVCGNHIHLFDQCLPILATKRMLHYMAKKEHLDGKFGWFFKTVGCIRVDREIHDENAKGEAISLLNNGYVIGLFPEGTRNKTNDIFLLPFKFGTVSMAKKTNATIVPFGLTGDYKFRSKNLTIRYGNPFKVENMTLEEANSKLYHEVERLMRENLKNE